MRLARALPILVLVLTATLLFAGDKKKPQQDESFSTLRFTVIKDDNEKPVRNASVILHPVDKNGSQTAGGFQLKTDADGKATSEGIPYGKLRIQVLAHGFQTFGEDFDVNQTEMNIDIRLKRPKEQFTIYDKPAGAAQPNNTPPAQTPPQTPPK